MAEETKSGMGKSTMLIVIVSFIVLVIVAFLLIRPGGSGSASGMGNKTSAPVAAH